MSLDVLLQLLSIAAQNSAYLAGLSWLAWRNERSRGDDAFHLVVIYALGAWLLALFVNSLSLNQFLAVCLVSFLACVLDMRWPTPSLHFDKGKSLIQIIVLASIALIAFDWVTSHAPISLFRSSLRPFSLVCALIAWALIFETGRTQGGMALRLGIRNHWAIEYWGRPLRTDFHKLKIACFLCWICVLTVPLSATGLLSSSILKDIAIAILIARIAATRGPWIVLAASVTLSILRTGIGFAFPSNSGPPLVELMVFVSLLFWLRYRGNRTAWDEMNGR